MLFVNNGYERIGLVSYYLSFTFIQCIVLAKRQYRFSMPINKCYLKTK